MTDIEKKIVELIKIELTSNLIPDRFRDGKVQHPMYGHCHHSSLALYNLLGGKEKGYKLQKAKDELDITHYWLMTINGEIIDITSAQYTDLNRQLPYQNKVDNKASYRCTKSAKIIISKIKSTL